MPSFKLIASQAKYIRLYKNLRVKVQRCCANIYFNRQCLKQGVIPTLSQYAHSTNDLVCRRPEVDPMLGRNM